MRLLVERVVQVETMGKRLFGLYSGLNLLQRTTQATLLNIGHHLGLPMYQRHILEIGDINQLLQLTTTLGKIKRFI
jgi:hypothetical protein